MRRSGAGGLLGANMMDRDTKKRGALTLDVVVSKGMCDQRSMRQL